MTSGIYTGGLHPSVIAAQQALSEKYGIPTFNLKGYLSTIPQTRPVSDINVNSGIYGKSGASLSDFQNFVKSLAPQKALVPTSPVVLRGGQIIDIPLTSKLVEGENPLSSREIPPSFSSSIQKYIPYIVLAGVGIAALTVLKK